MRSRICGGHGAEALLGHRGEQRLLVREVPVGAACVTPARRATSRRVSAREALLGDERQGAASMSARRRSPWW